MKAWLNHSLRAVFGSGLMAALPVAVALCQNPPAPSPSLRPTDDEIADSLRADPVVLPVAVTDPANPNNPIVLKELNVRTRAGYFATP